MLDNLYQVEAPHFVAGFIVDEPRDPVVIEAADIIKYMVGWPLSKVSEYCVKKGWTLR